MKDRVEIDESYAHILKRDIPFVNVVRETVIASAPLGNDWERMFFLKSDQNQIVLDILTSPHSSNPDFSGTLRFTREEEKVEMQKEGLTGIEPDNLKTMVKRVRDRLLLYSQENPDESQKLSVLQPVLDVLKDLD